MQKGLSDSKSEPGGHKFRVKKMQTWPLELSFGFGYLFRLPEFH